MVFPPLLRLQVNSAWSREEGFFIISTLNKERESFFKKIGNFCYFVLCTIRKIYSLKDVNRVNLNDFRGKAGVTLHWTKYNLPEINKHTCLK
jgi:hypothetical protein